MTKFEIGKNYGVFSPGDQDGYDTTSVFTVISRTDKFVTLSSPEYESHLPRGPKRRKVCVIDDEECCDPVGRYSMAPVLRANRDLIA